MDRLIFTAYTGMNASMVTQRVIASNMANTGTIGFRSEQMQFTPMSLKGAGLEARAISEGEVHSFDASGGALTQTGRKLDIAMTGSTLMAVQAKDGEEAYTRRGDLSLTADGLLVNGDGLPVLGQQGQITVPPNLKVSIAPDGQVLAADPTSPNAQPTVVDTIKLVDPTGSRIEKRLDGLFGVYGGGVLPEDGAARVQPEALEQSNVNSSAVLVDMVQAQRLFELRSKTISTAKDMDEATTQLMRISGS